MVNWSNIVCKTVGIAGLSAATYDAYASAKRHSVVASEELTSDIFLKSYAATRSNSNGSRVTSAIQNKINDLRTKNPIVPIVGKFKGFIGGFLGSLADNFIPVTLSAVAIAAKGRFQKVGAWGLGIYGLYQIAKEGFGLGKTTAIDK